MKLLSSTDKIYALQQKIKIWKIWTSSSNLELFPLVAKTNHEETLSYFELWMFYKTITVAAFLPCELKSTIGLETHSWKFSLKEELTDILHDRTLKLKHTELDLDSFCTEIENEYPIIAKKAQKILLQFSTA